MRKYFLMILLIPFLIGAGFDSYDEKTTPENNDIFLILDKTNGGTKKVKISNIPGGSGDDINWDSVDREIQTDNINWSSVINQEIQRRGINWNSVINQEIQKSGINWSSVIGQEIQTAGLNWLSVVNQEISSSGINWSTVELANPIGWVRGGTLVYPANSTDTVVIGSNSASSSSTTTVELIKQAGKTPFRISDELGGNGNLFVVNSLGNVGIGTFAVNSKLYIRAATAQTFVGISTAAGGPNITLRSDLGTAQSAGETLGFMYFTGMGNATNALNGAQIKAIAADAWTTSSDPTALSFWTAPSGSTALTERMTIIETGSIGIGTTRPNARLAVVKSGSTDPFHISSAAGGLGDYLKVTSSGNVGISTLAPGSKLDIQGTLRAFSSTSSVTVKSSANQACNTTCAGSMNIWAQNTADMTMVAPTDGAADVCGCLGP